MTDYEGYQQKGPQTKAKHVQTSRRTPTKSSLVLGDEIIDILALLEAGGDGPEKLSAHGDGELLEVVGDALLELIHVLRLVVGCDNGFLQHRPHVLNGGQVSGIRRPVLVGPEVGGFVVEEAVEDWYGLFFVPMGRSAVLLPDPLWIFLIIAVLVHLVSGGEELRKDLL